MAAVQRNDEKDESGIMRPRPVPSSKKWYDSRSLRRSVRSPSDSIKEKSISFIFLLAGAVSMFTTLGIIFVLSMESIQFFRSVSIVEFFTGTKWSPLISPHAYGILPLVCGTLLIGVGASIVAIPIGALSALFLSEYCKGKFRVTLKSTLEILAGIPTVVYGFFAVTVITPTLQKWITELETFNALSAAIVVGMMIIPTIASLSEDAFRAVPRDLREAAYGLGARKFQVALKIVFPAALSGFVASVLLGFSRAIGETMAVTLAAGATPRLTLNPLQSIQTMTAYIVQVSMGDTPAGTVEYQSLFAVGMTLFGMTLLSNFIAQRFVRRFRQGYL